MVEEEAVLGGWKTGVRVRSDDPLVKAIDGTRTGEARGGGVEGGGEWEMPFAGDGDVGSGVSAGDTSSGCGSGLTSGSDSGAGFRSGSGEASLGSCSCSLTKDFPGRVAVGKSSTFTPGEGRMYAPEATTGVPGSRSGGLFDGFALIRG